MKRFLIMLLLLSGCAEGGIGGTGSVIQPPSLSQATLVNVTGQGNKGPLAEAAQVDAQTLDEEQIANGTTVGVLGEFTIALPLSETVRLNITGPYFSEHLGAYTNTPISLDALVTTDGTAATNINVATHIAVERLLVHVQNGLAPEVATQRVTDELTLALGSVLRAPVNPLVLSSLRLLNAGSSDNAEGNAWLLALSALVEGVAIAEQLRSGDDLAEITQQTLDNFQADFSVDGLISSPLLDQLRVARGNLNPDLLHTNLLNLSDDLTAGALRLSGLAGSPDFSLSCQVFGSEVFCAEREAAAVTLSEVDRASQDIGGNGLELEQILADMNRFIDTDGDGVVNEIDADDDNDGIADELDASPYGND